MDYLLFIGYLFLFAWLITRIKLFNNSGLSNIQLTILFLLKIIAGMFYGWIGIAYGYMAYMYDTWGYHKASIIEYNLFFTHPSLYFTNLFQNNYYDNFSGLFAPYNSYWNDLKSNAFIKLLSVFDIFSFGNYYINVIFFSFITLIGPVLLFRIMNDVFPGKKMQVLVTTFLIPSFIYWTSGIHKDGIVVTALCLIIYQFYFAIKQNSFSLKKWVVIAIGLFIIFVFRNYLLVPLIPALFTWYLATRYSAKTKLIFFGLYSLFTILFFTLRYIHPQLDFPKAVVNKQNAFKQLEGGSGIPLHELTPSATGFIKNTPQALSNVLLRPYPRDVKHVLSLAAAIEVWLMIIIVIFSVFFRQKNITSTNHFIWFCIFFSFSFLITIGLTVNFIGALVRYRSIIAPFIIVPVTCIIDWKRVYSILFNNIKIKNNIN